MTGNLLIINAKIWQWQVYPDRSNGFSPLGMAKYGSIRIVDGIIQEVVEDEVVNVGEFDNVIDANGSLVLPGMIDSHIHVGMLGESQHYINLVDCETIESLKEKLVEGYQKETSLPFIIGFNWDQEKIGRFPQMSDLDELGIDKPIFLWRACWHIAVVNRNAMELAKLIGSDGRLLQINIEGGAFDVDVRGFPTGVIRERAVEPVIAAISKNKTFEQRLQFVKEGLQLCLQSGLTAVETNDEGCYDCYEKLQAENDLPIRVFLTPNYAEIDDVIRRTNGPVPLSSTKQRLAVERIKIFSDGSLGAETAAIKEVGENHKGILIHTKESLVRMITDASEKGFRVEIHAIGDAAAEQVVKAMEESAGTRGIELNRPILTHCQVLSELSIEKMMKLNVLANVQPSFVPTDMRWVQNRLSAEKFPFAYAWKTLLQKGIHVIGGSDAPIENPSPFKGVFDAVFRSNIRRKKEFEKEEQFRPEECLSLSEAIWIYSKEGAYACGYEDVLGEIRQGNAADLVLIDATVLENPSNLHDIKPSMVFVEGKLEYAKEHHVSVMKGFGSSQSVEQYNGTIKSDAPFIPGKGGYFSSDIYCGEVVSIGYCSCSLHFPKNLYS